MNFVFKMLTKKIADIMYLKNKIYYQKNGYVYLDGVLLLVLIIALSIRTEVNNKK